MNNVANHALLRCKIFGLKIWHRKKLTNIMSEKRSFSQRSTFRLPSKISPPLQSNPKVRYYPPFGCLGKGHWQTQYHPLVLSSTLNTDVSKCTKNSRHVKVLKYQVILILFLKLYKETYLYHIRIWLTVLQIVTFSITSIIMFKLM